MADPAIRVVAYAAAAPTTDGPARARVLELAQACAGPVVVLATCHRVELYAPDRVPEHDALLGAGASVTEGLEAVRRVVAVATGLTSAVVAEDQLLHQVRAAVTAARRTGPLPMDLDRALDAALSAGRLARSWRPRGPEAPRRSLAQAAVDVARDRLGDLQGRRVLVVGAGTMGSEAAHGLRAGGATVAVTSRTEDHGIALARRVEAALWPFDPGARLDEVDLVVVGLAGPWPLGPASLDRLVARRLVVDLSMPPALPPEAIAALGDRYVGIDALAVAGTSTAVEERFRERIARLVDDTVDRYLETHRRRSAMSAADLAGRLERERREGIDAYLRARPDLDPAARAALDSATRDVVERLFRVPLQRLAHDPHGERRRAAEELFG